MTTPPIAAKPTSKAASSVTTDWDQIELEYRAGIKPLRQIAEANGISEGAIRKRAKRDEWTRDLSAKINARADDLVRKGQVRNEVRTESRQTERVLVEANALAIADIRLAHRTDIQRTRRITMLLLGELEDQASRDTQEALEELAATLREIQDDFGALDDAKEQLVALYTQVRNLPNKAKILKDLGESLRVLVALERQAFGMDDKGNQITDGFTEMLNHIASTTGNGFAPVQNDPAHDDNDDEG